MGYQAGEKAPEVRRNGKRRNTVRTEKGPMSSRSPRDREATFEPQVVPKHQGTFQRLRRQDHVHVWPRHEHPRDPGRLHGITDTPDASSSRVNGRCRPPPRKSSLATTRRVRGLLRLHHSPFLGFIERFRTRAGGWRAPPASAVR
ncbi:MAG: transposase [Planctomycetes bacterium]|nr:transposase [Planctomycetota bacterium]